MRAFLVLLLAVMPISKVFAAECAEPETVVNVCGADMTFSRKFSVGYSLKTLSKGFDSKLCSQVQFIDKVSGVTLQSHSLNGAKKPAWSLSKRSKNSILGRGLIIRFSGPNLRGVEFCAKD